VLAQQCGIQVITKVDTVGEATEIALANVGDDGVVLFSPAAPTPPDVGNWETRSGQFRDALAAANR
jgi:UDP-N-acetylmuramoylalanine-D-glutamate ligase